LSDARNALFAWSGAKKARETRLKLSTMKNWKNFVHYMNMWRVIARGLRFLNLRRRSRRHNAISKGSAALAVKRNAKFCGIALGRMYDFAYVSKRTKKLNEQAAKHFFTMYSRRVLYEWADLTAYRRDVRRRGDLVARTTFEHFRLRSWNTWFRQWWDKEVEKRANHHGLRYTLRHYLIRFVKGGRKMKQERLASYKLQKTARRFLIKKRAPTRALRAAAVDKFFRGRIGRYHEDCRVEEHVRFRKIDPHLIKVSGVFISEQVRRKAQFFFKTKKLENPIMLNLRKEVKENLIIPKFTQYSFPFPLPSAHMLNKILSDELGVLLRGEGRNGVASR
jgi:hypothetical protein